METEARKYNVKDLNEALRVLDDAAQRSSQEVQEMIKSDFKHLKGTFEEISPEVKTALSAVGNSASEAVKATAENASELAKETAQDVDQHVKANPWWYIGGTAVAGGILGYFLARKR